MSRAVCLAASLLLAACSSEVSPEGGGGSGGDGGAGGAPPQPTCPSVEGTWDMVLVPKPDGSSFCIDSREATNDQYAAFLESGAAPDLHEACAEVVDFTPKDAWPPEADRGGYPVSAVTWCDAQAFCEANGKRLCGGPDGEIRSIPVPVDSDEEATLLTEMKLACTRGGTQNFPYGDEFESNRCNAYPPGELLASADGTSCEGGYPGIYNLAGNIFEWEGVCLFVGNLEKGSGPYCKTYIKTGCRPTDGIPTDNPDRGVLNWSIYLGFRCCADPVAPD